MDINGKKTIAICESQPVTAEGLQAILSRNGGMTFLGRTESLPAASELVRQLRPDVCLVDKSLGIQAVMDWVGQAKMLSQHTTEVVVWGVSITEAEALRFLQSGAKGILRKTSDASTVIACLEAVASGSSWMADSVFHSTQRMERQSRSELTPREQQVLELVEQGMKNKEIARELGIRPGTVKIHLKHIFEKTGVRGRYGLALSVMREKGLLEMAS
ncbi:MAG TPA: response regulator transcription factor [Bryobacteraceae bacterium]|nr:response regulator transcription factor [Bryobacteraceae bacterium]